MYFLTAKTAVTYATSFRMSLLYVHSQLELEVLIITITELSHLIMPVLLTNFTKRQGRQHVWNFEGQTDFLKLLCRTYIAA